MATKKTAKKAAPKAKAAPKTAAGPAPTVLAEFVTTEPNLSHNSVWRAKVAIQSLTALELDGFEKNCDALVKHGPGVLAAIKSRRAELAA